MLIAVKANREMKIADDAVNEYAAGGYTVLDMDGNIVAKPGGVDDVKKLKAENADLRGRLAEAAVSITALVEENEKLKAELQKLQDTKKAAVKPTAATTAKKSE